MVKPSLSKATIMQFLLMGWAFTVSIDPIFLLDYKLPAVSHLFSISVILLSTLWNSNILKTSHLQLIALFLILITCGVSAPLDLVVSVKGALTILYYASITFSAYLFFSKYPERIGYILFAASLGVFFCSIYALVFHFNFGMRLTVATGYNPTWFGASCAAICLVSMYYFYYSDGKVQEIVAIIFLVFFLAQVLLSMSQSSLYSLIASILILISYGRGSRIRMLLYGLAALPIASYIVGKYDLLVHAWRVLRTFSNFGSDWGIVTASRSVQWVNLLVSKNISIFGTGWENSGMLSNLGISAHNNYITVLLEAGVVGLILFLTILFLVYFPIRKQRFTTVCFIFFLIFMNGNDLIHYKYAWFMIICITGLALKERNRVQLKANIPNIWTAKVSSKLR